VIFNDFIGRHTAEQERFDPITPLKERLHNIERKLLDLPSRSEVTLYLEPKADVDMISELKR